MRKGYPVLHGDQKSFSEKVVDNENQALTICQNPYDVRQLWHPHILNVPPKI